MERVRAWRGGLLGTAALVVPLLGLAAPATAADGDENAAAAASVLAITAPADQSFVPGGTVVVTGSKAVDSTVEVPSPNGGDPACVIEPGGELWSCSVNLPDGSVPVSAIERPADGSAPVQVTIVVRSLSAPGIDGLEPALINGVVSGTGYPGAEVRIVGDGPEPFDLSCGPVLGGGVWSCAIPVAVSGTYAVTVEQRWPGTGDASPPATRTLLVDKDPPPLPAIVAPNPDSTVAAPFTVSGTGESGARVDVFVDSVLACSAMVVDGAWACAASGASGPRTVQAIQWDPAGNGSGTTRAVPLIVAEPSQGGSAQPAQPADPRPPGQQPSAPEAAPPPPQAPQQTVPQQPRFLPPPIGGRTDLPPLETWGLPTGYGGAIPSAPEVAVGWAGGGWIASAALGAAFLVLVAIPLRVLGGAVLGWRVRPPAVRLAGRNRRRRADQEPAPRNPWLVGAVTVLVAGALVAVAGGIQAEARFARLAIAAVVGVALLNALSVLAARLGGASVARIQPNLLAVAAVLALGSRAVGLQPPLVFGIVLVASAVAVAGRVAFVQLLTPWAVGMLAWLAYGVGVADADGFVAAFGGELLAVLVVGGLGSALVLALPVGRLPGRILADRSPVAWGAVTFALAVSAAAILAQGAAGPLWWIAPLAVAFAAVVYASWLWFAHVAPSPVAE